MLIRRTWIYMLQGSTIVGLFVFDRIAKWIAVHRLVATGQSAQDSHTLIEWLHGQMVLHYNPDIAFNLPLPKMIIVPAVALFCLYLVNRLIRAVSAKDWSLGMIILMPLIGATSNLMDRLQYGAVIDYISFGGGFGFFNVADILIIGGIALWVLRTL